MYPTAENFSTKRSEVERINISHEKYSPSYPRHINVHQAQPPACQANGAAFQSLHVETRFPNTSRSGLRIKKYLSGIDDRIHNFC